MWPLKNPAGKWGPLCLGNLGLSYDLLNLTEHFFNLHKIFFFFAGSKIYSHVFVKISLFNGPEIITWIFLECVWDWKTQEIFWTKYEKINLKSSRTGRVSLP